jgi:hypothetical protein
MTKIQEDMELAQMVRRTTQELSSDEVKGVRLIRSYLEVLTQKTRDIHVSALSDEDCLTWVGYFVDHPTRQHERENEQPSKAIQISQHDENQIRWVCRNRRFFLTTCGRI